jgi:hypothetical protein
MLPATERTLVSLRGAAIKTVAGFGAWRGAQVSVAPLVLTSMRIAVTAAAGAAALGELELARIYVAPILLSVQGFGSYLLSTYARDKSFALPVLIRRAWRAGLGMAAGALVIGAVIVAMAPLVSGAVSDIPLDRVAMVGWVLYVAALASLQPFASLAAARGRPSQVLRCRIVDAIVVIVLIPLLLSRGLSASWTPFILAAGLVLGGILVRQFVLKPLSRYQPRRSAGFLRSRTSYAIR